MDIILFADIMITFVVLIPIDEMVLVLCDNRGSIPNVADVGCACTQVDGDKRSHLDVEVGSFQADGR